MKKNFPIRIYLMLLAILVVFSCTKEDPVVVTGNIEGTVSNAEFNQVIQGVIVNLSPVDRSKVTGSDGKFSFMDLEAGNYKLSFEKEGFEDNSKNITLIAGQTSPADISLTPIIPVLSVTPSILDFGEEKTDLPFSIQNTGKGSLIWEVIESIGWLNISQSSGTTQTGTSPVVVTINRNNMEPKDYEGNILVTSNGGNASIVIKVVVKGPKLEVTPMNLDFGLDKNKLTLLIKNTGVGSLDYNLSSDAPWISLISPNSGTVMTETDAIEISVNRSGMNYDNYSGTINVLSRGGNVSVDVKMIVPDPNKPQLSISPKTINFGNQTPSDNLTIQNTGRGTLEWSLREELSWINVDRNSGSLIANESVVLLVTANRNGLAPNNYAGSIIVSSNGGNETCNVEMEISAEPILFFEPNTLNFGHDKESLPFIIKNNGTGNLTWNLTKNKEWINLSETSNNNQSTINVSVNRTALDYGVYSGQVGISSNGGTGSIVITVEKRKPNTAPVVDFTITPSSGYLETNFALHITCTDDYTSVANLQTRWKWQDEDAFSSWSTDKSNSHTYTTAGTKRITVEVKDEDGLTTSISKSIVANKNEKPTASFTVTPISGTINTVFTVDANASSDDFTSKENLQIRWKWGDSPDFTAWTTTKTASHTYALAGNWTITLEVKDDGGLTNSTTRNITILDSEIEPNNTVQLSQIISNNATISGSIGGITGSDVDNYAFTPLENGNFSFSILNKYSGSSYGSTIGECVLFRYNEGHIQGYDYLTSISWVEKGYRINSSTVPVSGGIKYVLQINTSMSSTLIPYELTAIFEPISNTDWSEPNNFITQATPINLNSKITAMIGYSDDFIDYYTFTPSKNGNFTFSIKNLHPSGISMGKVGRSYLYVSGESNSIAAISNPINVSSTSISSTVSLVGGVKYLIEIPQYDSRSAAPYELTTIFQ